MSLMLSVIIPAYNEANRLPPYLDKILKYLDEDQQSSYEVIVVDDGSSDNTFAVAEGYAAKNSRVHPVRLAQNRGKGFAVKTGMLMATGKLRLFADADGATPIEELERLRKVIEQGADVALASRALHDDSCVVNGLLRKKIIGMIFNLIVKAIAVRGIHDTQCGFKLFTSEVADNVFPLQAIYGFAFDVEILFLCRKKGYRIMEVPVNWTDARGSKVRIIPESLRMFRDTVQARINDYRGRYR